MELSTSASLAPTSVGQCSDISVFPTSVGLNNDDILFSETPTPSPISLAKHNEVFEPLKVLDKSYMFNDECLPDTTVPYSLFSFNFLSLSVDDFLHLCGQLGFVSNLPDCDLNFFKSLEIDRSGSLSCL